ncbi:type IV pilus modification PilV family protein [Agarivorans sp. QJM3NY_25]|uniref:type IV pilus modification PilV family protein n=1 Tax=Agarivorans sp. QJM3NY_25 TaxID=3421430 RepID=UPI003D7ED456
MPNKHVVSRAVVRGFTLIELVVGMVVMAIALVVISSFMAPLARRSIDPVYQIRAAELGSSLMNEILTKSFDQRSDHTGGGLWRCGEASAPTASQICTTRANYGPDGESRAQYNDVDDYVTDGRYITIDDSLGVDLADVYRHYSYRVAIDSSEHGQNQAKRIDLWVRAPNSVDYAFSAYRWNY